MSPHLSGIRGPLTGRTFALGDQPLTIGRAADNAVVIASPRASRHHAHIRREGASFVLYDLGSANGTLVNGQRVQRAVLQPGDLIDIGDEVFRFEAGYQQDVTLLSAPQAQPPAYPSQPQPPAYP
ncbi:FHA domain-containing protein, partial [Roseiflexus sp.]